MMNPHNIEPSAERSSMLATIAERKKYVNFTEADARELAELKTWSQSQAPQAADAFYDQLGQFDKPMGVISQAGSSLDRLRNTLHQYLLELFDGEYGEAHFKRRYQIGVRHDLIGLTPRWYTGGFSIHFQNLVPGLVRRYWWRPRKLTRKLLALNKILNLDEQIAIDTYFDLRSSKVATTSIEIAQTTKTMSDNARQQSTQVLQTSSAMEEITASVSEVYENATATLGAAQTATERARDGAKEIQESRTGIEAANQAVRQLRGRAETISTVIDLIQEITTQTNILALNAAIEAAGAGESGQRFSIVADEVRRLAGRTAESTLEITGLITEIQADTSEVAALIEVSTRQAGKAEGSIAEIVAGIQAVQEMVGQIASAAAEQSQTSSEVAEALILLAQASQQISTATEQTALATEDLSQMAERLRE